MTDFGRDTSCTTTLLTGRFATGVRLVAEASFRRVNTRRGSLRGGEAEKNFGIMLSDYVGRTTPAADAAAMPGVIRNELLKDERIETVDTEVLIVTAGPLVTFGVTIDALTALGPFQLQISVSQVTLELLGIKADS